MKAFFSISITRIRTVRLIANILHSKQKSPLLLKNFCRSHHPSTSTTSPTHLNSLLNATGETQDIRHATQIHAQIITNNYTSLAFLFNNLLNIYANCGHLHRSLLAFSHTHNDAKNIITWTSLITQFSRCHKPLEALSLFNQMRRTGISPNHFTFSAILSACANTAILAHGEQMHSLIHKHGFQTDIFVGSAIIDLYAKCGNTVSAKAAFDEMPQRNLVSWNAMIVGFSQNKNHEQAIGLFMEIINDDSVIPDEVSFSSVLSTCADMGSLDVGRQVHALVVKHGLIFRPYVKNSLVDMYGKSGCFADAIELFKTMAARDVVTWNVMAMGWAQNDCFEEACNYFWIMRNEGISPDEASFSTALYASASLAALDQGTSIHDQIVKTGFISNTCVQSSLITMYAKCGSLFDAHRVFEEIKNRNVVCWTAMITAYQQNGLGDRVIELFEQMLAEGLKPDHITFVSVLSACSHTGRVEEGFGYFNSMSSVYGMKPGPEHYACMVDMLGRAGQLNEAKRFIESMPVRPDPSVWGALLGACRSHGHLEMGKQVAEKLFEVEPNNPGNYVLLANIYMHHGRLEEANEIRRLMGINGVRKEPGCSWIDIKNVTHVFTVHDRSHSWTDEIYKMLGKMADLVKEKGYVAENQFAVNDAEEFKEQSLWYHSEKLALAFGLLTLPVGAPIRIKKNLRTCGDCHTVMKYVSEIFKREIIVRDVNRFHRFVGGFCSCGDYW
ncbi:putative pentatricopeptide repeat-containing protein At3g13770, mitochondrial [Macadamia integrifolia]|uniref:putative pentatricopeptide repeat-containing protein At3g13770, mitochondrial n=1 Tax=Macadamia integrifolia TaxID=60698 RepID=UPI001C4FA749|nr:putative pentatricopeptide repeat-containing protein At3g13770, mitochondrial [Macadamia integrifolia]